MNFSQKIYLDVNNPEVDKHIKIRLEQTTNTLEFLTIKLDTKDAYQNFNSDYGVLVGRVYANDGVGIQNAKVSIFIELSDEDKNNDNIRSIYPYKNPRDKNVEGKRYNLLPRAGIKNYVTGIIKPKQTFGSFPLKEEILTNETLLTVYKKYYKYTTVTNEFGDYMIFGVPVGTQTVHMSVDITDIGKYSMTPAAMVTNLGYSPNLFTENNTKIKPSTDLNDLPHIETQEISVNIIPFWGDVDNFEIGITRQDFRIRATLSNTFVIFGSVFTDGSRAMWGSDPNNVEAKRLLFCMSDDDKNDFSRIENVGIKTKRTAKATEKIYYFPNNITDDEIQSGNAFSKMLLLDPTEYSIYKRDGDFAVIINCNRKCVIIDDNGNEIPTETGGIYTEFKGFMTLEITPDDLPHDFHVHSGDIEVKPFRQILKFPQYASMGDTFTQEEGSDEINDTNTWRNQHFTFTGGGFYSVARFHPLVHYTTTLEGINNKGFFPLGNIINRIGDADEGELYSIYNVGVIQTNDYTYTGNTQYQMVSNGKLNDNNREMFGAAWLNFSIYLPQMGYISNGAAEIGGYRLNTQASYDNDQNKSFYYIKDNTQKLVNGYYNTKWFGRSDLHWTDFVNVPKEDIVLLYENTTNTKGFKKSELANDYLINLSGSTYRNGTYINTDWTINQACPQTGRINSLTPLPTDSETYFYKGFDTSDCIEWVMQLGLI